LRRRKYHERICPKRAVDQAYREIETLAERLAPVIEAFAPAGRAMEMARILAGLQPFDDGVE